MTNKRIRTAGSIIIAAMTGIILAACTTVVHDRPATVAVVKEKSPDVVVVPSN